MGQESKEVSMALSDDAIIALAEKHLVLIDNGEFTFARAIEAEVRKQDEALILQLVAALEVATTPLAKDRQEVLAAITAARARLEGKP
jgi:hypothetical protein